MQLCLIFEDMGYEGKPYYNLIYSRPTQAIVLMMQCSHMEKCRCSFELCGDFMLVEDMSVWLIEINTNPHIHSRSLG